MATRQDTRTVREGFEDPEGLRALLNRLHAAGHGSWRDDPEAAALMLHAAGKYTALAKRHGLDPWEAAAAAFDAMRTSSVRKAADPWAVVTRAVQVTCIAEERANGLLCSVHQARRPRYSVFHDPERFCDRENPLTDYHPAFRVAPAEPAGEPERVRDASTGVAGAVEDAIALLALLSWEPHVARASVEYLASRLAESSSRTSAFEMLRRDRHARALLDLPGTSWTTLLRALLGTPDPTLAHTNAGRGVLLRLLIGEPLRALLLDDELVAAVSLAAPRRHGGGERG